MKKIIVFLVLLFAQLMVVPANAQKTVYRGAVLAVSFSPDGKNLAAGYATDEVKLWDVKKRNAIMTFKHGDWVYSVSFSPDGKTLASAGKEIKLWNITTGTGILKIADAHKLGVKSIVFSSDGELIASGGYGDIKIWNVTTGQLIRTFKGFRSWVYSVALSPDNKLSLFNMLTYCYIWTFRVSF